MSACTVFLFGYETNRMCQTKRKHRRNMNGLLTGKSEGQENVTEVKFSLSCQLEQSPSAPPPCQPHHQPRALHLCTAHTGNSCQRAPLWWMASILTIAVSSPSKTVLIKIFSSEPAFETVILHRFKD